MDSKLPEETAEINVASNVWIKPDGEEPLLYEAAEWVPGDLRVSFSDVSRDRQTIRRVLNPRQQHELTTYRFFLRHGQEIDFYELPRHPRDNSMDALPQANSCLILEDNPDRLALMADALTSLPTGLSIRHWDNAWEMRREAAQHLSSARLLSLDYDLRDSRTAGKHGPGCGMDVVDWLRTRSPVCPVIVHTSLPEESRAMVCALRESGWRAESVIFSTREHAADWLALVEDLCL